MDPAEIREQTEQLEDATAALRALTDQIEAQTHELRAAMMDMVRESVLDSCWWWRDAG